MDFTRLGSNFLDYLEQEFLRGFDIRILRELIRLGNKFQRNRPGRIWAQAGFRPGRESVSQPSLPCKMYDEIGLGLLMLATAISSLHCEEFKTVPRHFRAS